MRCEVKEPKILMEWSVETVLKSLGAVAKKKTGFIFVLGFTIDQTKNELRLVDIVIPEQQFTTVPAATKDDLKNYFGYSFTANDGKIINYIGVGKALSYSSSVKFTEYESKQLAKLHNNDDTWVAVQVNSDGDYCFDVCYPQYKIVFDSAKVIINSSNNQEVIDILIQEYEKNVKKVTTAGYSSGYSCSGSYSSGYTSGTSRTSERPEPDLKAPRTKSELVTSGKNISWLLD